MLEDAIVLIVWGGLFFSLWSALAVLLTFAFVGLPALLGWWQLVQLLSMLLVLGAAALWMMALAGVSTGLPLPTRERAGIVVFPIVALWPALTAFFAARHRRTLHALAKTNSQGDA